MGGKRGVFVAASLVLAAATLTGCGKKTIAVPHAAPLGVVAFQPDAAVAANGVIVQPKVKPVCGSDATTFGTELVNTPPNEAKVTFEWGAIAEDPKAEALNLARIGSNNNGGDLPFPGVKEPKRMLVAGTVQDFQLSTGDLTFNHPFGLDMTMDIKPDPAYRATAFKLGTGADSDGPPTGTIHIEIQQGLVPHSGTGLQDFLSGYEPQNGDRIAAFGPWIVDCGHDDWHSELHELTFLAFGHPEGKTTVSHVFYNPYRQSQFLSANPAITNQVDDYARWADPTVNVFAQYLYHELLRVGHLEEPHHDHIESHQMLDANLIPPTPWEVCAPGKGSKLTVAYHFAVRTGVSITASPSDATGCVTFTPRITANYVPVVPLRKDCVDPWSELNAQLQAALGNPNVDVRQLIEAQVPKSFIPAVERDPTIDCYDPLVVPAVEATGTGHTVTTSDAQPYPFYGEVKVGWAS